MASPPCTAMLYTSSLHIAHLHQQATKGCGMVSTNTPQRLQPSNPTHLCCCAQRIQRGIFQDTRRPLMHLSNSSPHAPASAHLCCCAQRVGGHGVLRLNPLPMVDTLPTHPLHQCTGAAVFPRGWSMIAFNTPHCPDAHCTSRPTCIDVLLHHHTCAAVPRGWGMVSSNTTQHP